MTTVTDIAMLACPGLGIGGWPPQAQVEPHGDRVRDVADDYGNTGNFQTDGPLWTPGENWKLRRNYTFGDGHTVYIKRNDRGFTTADGY
jgi:prepilin-type processing-associated H-X9-DG protein